MQAQTQAEEMEEEVELEDEPESNELLELDPKYWKVGNGFTESRRLTFKAI